MRVLGVWAVAVSLAVFVAGAPLIVLSGLKGLTASGLVWGGPTKNNKTSKTVA